MPEEISDKTTARSSFTQSLRRLSKVVSAGAYTNVLKIRAAIVKNLRETPGSCKWNMAKPVEELKLNITFDKGSLIIVQSLRDSVYYVVYLSDVPKCESFNPNEESTQHFLFVNSAFTVEIHIPTQQMSSTQVIVSEGLMIMAIKGIEAIKVNSAGIEGLLEISINTAVNHLSRYNNVLKNWATTVKDLRETPDSWVKWNMTNQVEEPRLNNIFYKGFLIVQCLRDLVCYVIDLSEVPKCGSYNAYGNEQMDMQVEVERMDPEQIQTWLSSQNYNEQVMKDLRDVNGKMLFGYSEEQLVKIVGSAFGYAIWNSLHGLSSQDKKKKREPGSSEEEQALKKSKKDLDVSQLCAPSAVQVPPLQSNEPKTFVTQTWLDETIQTIHEYYKNIDSNTQRIPPMALIRCSRGGKTRALQEISRKLKDQLPEAAILFVSFGDWSTIEDWEQDDPEGALCRRIAFAALQSRDYAISQEQFRDFCKTRVTSEEILKWLDNFPCILLIDELNLLTAFSELPDAAERISLFLKKNFLVTKNRYFIFSSHVVSTTGSLSEYMDNHSSRQVSVKELPLIPDLKSARESFNYNLLNARQALYYALVPSLIYVSSLPDHEALPHQKRKNVVSKIIKDQLVSNQMIRQLLSSFITGEPNQVLPQLLQFMSVSSNLDEECIIWIPFHLCPILKKFAQSSPFLQNNSIIQTIVSLFDQFRFEKEKSGGAWECLFLIALLIRVTTGLFDQFLLPLNLEVFGNCSVSYNSHSKEGDPLASTIEPFLLSISKPDPNTLPHIAVYYPQHATFERYDLIVATYDNHGERTLYGYQLKEGAKRPKDSPHDKFKSRSFVVRGEPNQNPTLLREWQMASGAQIDLFFGESGKYWTPNCWRKFQDNI